MFRANCKHLSVDFLVYFAVQKHEIEKLIVMFNKYTEGCTNRKLDRLKFRDILHDMFGMTDDMLMDRGEYHSLDFNH